MCALYPLRDSGRGKTKLTFFEADNAVEVADCVYHSSIGGVVSARACFNNVDGSDLVGGRSSSGCLAPLNRLYNSDCGCGGAGSIDILLTCAWLNNVDGSDLGGATSSHGGCCLALLESSRGSIISVVSQSSTSWLNDVDSRDNG